MISACQEISKLSGQLFVISSTMPTSISSIPKCLPGLSTASRAPCAWFSIGRASAATISWHGSRPRLGRRAPAACLAARRATGAAFRTALDALALWRGPEDTRNHGQRMADALAELLDHHMNEGKLPRRKGVRPHVTLTTTLEGLKGELGQPAAELELGLPISGKTVERLACDCTMSRVLLADSVVVDVGRATRTISPATRRALQVRDRGCR